MFGDTKKVLSTEFVRQGYLEYNKTPNTEPPVYEYTWGQRAKHETSKRMVLNFVCQVSMLNRVQIYPLLKNSFCEC